MSPPWRDFQVIVCLMISSITFHHNTVNGDHLMLQTLHKLSYFDWFNQGAQLWGHEFPGISQSLMPNATFFFSFLLGSQLLPDYLLSCYSWSICAKTHGVLDAKKTRLVLNNGFSSGSKRLIELTDNRKVAVVNSSSLISLNLWTYCKGNNMNSILNWPMSDVLQAALTFPSSPSMCYTNGKIDSPRSKANWLISSGVILEIVQQHGW